MKLILILMRFTWKDYVYWTEQEAVDLRRANKFNGLDRETIGDGWIGELRVKIFQDQSQPSDSKIQISFTKKSLKKRALKPNWVQF